MGFSPGHTWGHCLSVGLLHCQIGLLISLCCSVLYLGSYVAGREISSSSAGCLGKCARTTRWPVRRPSVRLCDRSRSRSRSRSRAHSLTNVAANAHTCMCSNKTINIKFSKINFLFYFTNAYLVARFLNYLSKSYTV